MPELETRAFVGVGGNLGDRLRTLRAAVSALGADVPETRVIASSSVYETRPLGPSKEPFLNAVVEVRTRLAPRRLLGQMLAIEARHGRQRTHRWGARTLDLDLLLVWRSIPSGWEGLTVDEEGLQLPHPRMVDRDFVLVPLRDLVGDEAVVQGRSVGDWLGGLGEEQRTVLRRRESGLLEGEGPVVRGRPQA